MRIFFETFEKALFDEVDLARIVVPKAHQRGFQLVPGVSHSAEHIRGTKAVQGGVEGFVEEFVDKGCPVFDTDLTDAVILDFHGHGSKLSGLAKGFHWMAVRKAYATSSPLM